MYVLIGDAVSWATGKSGHMRIRVRACATFAGFRAHRSPWLRSSRVSRESLMYPHLPVTPEVRLYRELLNSWPTSDLSGLYEAYLQVRLALEDPTRGRVVDVLEPFVPNVVQRVALAHRVEEIGPFPTVVPRSGGAAPMEVASDLRAADEHRSHGTEDAD